VQDTRRPESIALISAAYPPYISGGIETQTYDLAHALSKLGLSVTVFCGGVKPPSVLREEEDLKVLRMPMARIPPRNVFFQLQNLSLLKNLLPHYDVVHTQHSSGSFYGIIKKKVGKPWVVSFHDHQLRRLLVFFDVKPWNLSMNDTMFYTFAYPIFEFLTRIELKWADHYVACGKSGLVDYLNFSKMDPRKVTLIPNGVNLDRIDSILNSSDVEGESGKSDFVLFTCGRWYASKGIQFLIRAMPYVKKRFNNVRLKVFGKGPMGPYFEKLIHSLKLEGTVALEGLVPYDRLILEMRNSDLAVFPSMIEVGASLAVMEAMACHKPLIAFEYPFSLEIIEHMKTGVLVPPKNVEALGECVCNLLGDEALRKRIGTNAREDVVRNHDVKNIALKYVEVYASVLS
jgi:glycosyltransferase involved in cell wall biosynthesis